ncbi:hypothetical protein VP01_3228g2 [Puccinia sorghi]|uniref:Uncharacterized protein n=1 Tax=Puccinia sorghi TaxID=27349 RepID=A0A0L6V043_9BASI|nr:hypothetical protein VP01_3228g2 [Puccinia sorghi]
MKSGFPSLIQVEKSSAVFGVATSPYRNNHPKPSINTHSTTKREEFHPHQKGHMSILEGWMKMISKKDEDEYDTNKDEDEYDTKKYEDEKIDSDGHNEANQDNQCVNSKIKERRDTANSLPIYLLYTCQSLQSPVLVSLPHFCFFFPIYLIQFSLFSCSITLSSSSIEYIFLCSTRIRKARRATRFNKYESEIEYALFMHSNPQLCQQKFSANHHSQGSNDSCTADPQLTYTNHNCATNPSGPISPTNDHLYFLPSALRYLLLALPSLLILPIPKHPSQSILELLSLLHRPHPQGLYYNLQTLNLWKIKAMLPSIIVSSPLSTVHHHRQNYDIMDAPSIPAWFTSHKEFQIFHSPFLFSLNLITQRIPVSPHFFHEQALIPFLDAPPVLKFYLHCLSPWPLSSQTTSPNSYFPPLDLKLSNVPKVLLPSGFLPPSPTPYHLTVMSGILPLPTCPSSLWGVIFSVVMSYAIAANLNCCKYKLLGIPLILKNVCTCSNGTSSVAMNHRSVKTTDYPKHLEERNKTTKGLVAVCLNDEHLVKHMIGCVLHNDSQHGADWQTLQLSLSGFINWQHLGQGPLMLNKHVVHHDLVLCCPIFVIAGWVLGLWIMLVKRIGESRNPYSFTYITCFLHAFKMQYVGNLVNFFLYRRSCIGLNGHYRKILQHLSIMKSLATTSEPPSIFQSKSIRTPQEIIQNQHAQLILTTPITEQTKLLQIGKSEKKTLVCVSWWQVDLSNTHTQPHTLELGRPTKISSASQYSSLPPCKMSHSHHSPKPIFKSAKATVLIYCLCVSLNDREEAPLSVVADLKLSAQQSVHNHNMLYIIKLNSPLDYSSTHCDCIIAKGFFYLGGGYNRVLVEFPGISTELLPKLTIDQAKIVHTLQPTHNSYQLTSLVIIVCISPGPGYITTLKREAMCADCLSKPPSNMVYTHL